MMFYYQKCITTTSTDYGMVASEWSIMEEHGFPV